MQNHEDAPVTLADNALDACTGGARPLSRLKKTIINQRLGDPEAETTLNSQQVDISAAQQDHGGD